MSFRPKHVICAKIRHLSRRRPKHVICAKMQRLDATTICVDVLNGISGYELKGGVGSVLIIFDQFFSKLSNLSRSSVSASTAVGHGGAPF